MILLTTMSTFILKLSRGVLFKLYMTGVRKLTQSPERRDVTVRILWFSPKWEKPTTFLTLFLLLDSRSQSSCFYLRNLKRLLSRAHIPIPFMGEISKEYYKTYALSTSLTVLPKPKPSSLLMLSGYNLPYKSWYRESNTVCQEELLCSPA